MRKTLTAIIIDDENHCRETLAWELGRHTPEIQVLNKLSSGQAAIDFLVHTRPDILFLDVDMPEMDGFAFLKQIDHSDLHVIFTTGYNEYAVQAFRVCATDFLLKPVEGEELKEAVEKVKTKLKASENPGQGLEKLFAALQKKGPRVSFPTAQGLEVVDPSGILYCKSDGNYTHIHFAEGNSMLISKPLKEVEFQLIPHEFLRVHHSFLVNLGVVIRYMRGDGGQVVLKDGTHLSVSRNRKDALLERL